MPYIPGFKNDIFISYPRENNRADPAGVQWVRELNRCLKIAIENFIPSKEQPAIFFDDHNFESGQLVDALLEEARRSAIFLAVLSPPYVAPGKFTLQEFDAFCDSRPPDEQIIINLYFLPVKRDDEPSKLRGPKKFDFYSTNENGVPFPLTPISNSNEYTSKLYTIAYHIVNRLDEMRRARLQPTRVREAVEATNSSGPSLTALIAHVTDDLVDVRDEVREYLEKLGVNVLPQAEYPSWGADFVNEFNSQVANADLYIQLLSKVRTDRVGSEMLSQGRFQYQTATALGKKTLLWREPADITKVQHYDKPLLELASAMSLEQFKATIRDQLSALANSKTKNIEPGDKEIRADADPFIYITAHQEDLSHAFALKEIADTLGGARIMEDSNKLKDFVENVPFAEAVIFIYGDAPRRFIDDWLARYRKLKASEFKSCPKLEGVYYAPPPKGQIDRRLRTGWKGLREFGSQEKLLLDDIRRIFSELHSGGRDQ